MTPTPLLTTILNLTAFHREHEKYYGAARREQAVVLQRHSRTLLALADRWTTAHPPDITAANPFAGARREPGRRATDARCRARGAREEVVAASGDGGEP